MQFFEETNLLSVLARVECMQLHYTNFLTKQVIGHTFVKDDFSKSNQIKSTKLQEVGTKNNQKPRTGLSLTNPRFSLLTFAVKDVFAQVNFMFLISQLASELKELLSSTKKKQFKMFYYVDTNNT